MKKWGIYGNETPVFILLIFIAPLCLFSESFIFISFFNILLQCVAKDTLDAM